MSNGLRALLLATTATIIAIPAHNALAASPLLPVVTGNLVTAAYDRTVADIQLELNRKGYDAGPVDGLIGARTRNAIADYQRRANLLVTGQPSETLLNHLRGTAATAPRSDPPAGANSETQQIVRLQKDLDRLGYDVSTTGQVDSSTESAIRAYQRDHNLLVTGAMNEALFAHVRESARAERRDTRDALQDVSVDANTIARIQRGLVQRGYKVGNMSGRYDARTRDAIEDYQRDRGVAVTGEPSDMLAEQLAEGVAPSLATRENIRQVQQALNARGYSAGPADGVMGPSTRSAITSYRSRNNMSASADITAELLTSLGIGTADSSSANENGSNNAGARFVVLSDDFSDGNYTSGPAWQVLAKTFDVRDGALTSSVTPPAAPSNEDIGRDMLKGVLGEVLGVQLPSQSDTAVIAQATPAFANVFELRTRLRETQPGDTRMHVGPYTGANASSGYRVVYDSTAAQPLAIVAGLDASSETVAATAQAPQLDDGAWHDLVFSRDDAGRMSLSVDGTVVLTGVDRRIEGSQSGVSFVNASGSWEMDSIEVMADRS
jgi:peptidoglycan hydrolase-like protein with peptidoglycan-binding domain